MDEGATADEKVVLGRLLAITTEINEKVSRLVWRVDDLEGRVEALEKTDASQELRRSLIDKGLWALVGLGVYAFVNGGIGWL